LPKKPEQLTTGLHGI